jgi:hypothetical protein
VTIQKTVYLSSPFSASPDHQITSIIIMRAAHRLVSRWSFFLAALIGVVGVTEAKVAPAATEHRKLSDFDWDIIPRPDFPQVAFNNATASNEVIFRYDTPLLYVNKTFDVTVFENNCKTIGSSAIVSQADDSVDRELTVELDIDLANITDSEYYTSLNITNAQIGLCLRVDYNLHGDSVNFHETNLTININLTAGFEITSLNQTRIAESAIFVNTVTDYPVTAFHCDTTSRRLEFKPQLAQGEILRFCVEIDERFTNENVYVTEILWADLDQLQEDLTTTHSDIVEDTLEGPLTEKLCQGGICNIQTLVETKWFNGDIPSDINATGVAILAFGIPTDRRQRFLRAPIFFENVLGSNKQDLERHLQVQDGDDANLAQFGLNTRLKVKADDDSPSTLTIVGGVLLIACSSYCCIVGIFLILKKRKSHEEEEETEQKSEQSTALVSDYDTAPPAGDAKETSVTSGEERSTDSTSESDVEEHSTESEPTAEKGATLEVDTTIATEQQKQPKCESNDEEPATPELNTSTADAADQSVEVLVDINNDDDSPVEDATTNGEPCKE